MRKPKPQDMGRWTLIMLLALVSCAGGSDLTQEKFLFRNGTIGHRESYKIKVPKIPKQNYEKLYLVGGHGHEFRVVYSDSSLLYFNNDPAVSSVNYSNYESIGFRESPFEDLKNDTIIGGTHKNGLYWKEIIFKDDSKLGYKNVPLEYVDLFDKALKTFKN